MTFLSGKKTALLVILATTLAGVSIYYITSAYFLNEAKKDIHDLLLSHRGLHQYIQRDMHPAFYRARDMGLIDRRYYDPAIFSSSFIVRVLHGYHNEERKKAGLSKIYYKMAAENPRNQVNRANDFEITILRMFNKNRNVKEYETILSNGGRRYLYYAIPFLETNAKCLKCHGKKGDAPPGLQAMYPGEGGFNDHVGNIRAIESLSAPIGSTLAMVYVISGSVFAGFFSLLMMGLFNSRLRFKVEKKTKALAEEIEVRKKAEADISLALNEKEILLKEIHHRVKNNMALITSLIDMKTMSIADETVKAVFRDCRQRINTIAGVHEKLYHSNNLKYISVRSYISDLVSDIDGLYGLGMRNIDMSVNVDDIQMTIDVLIPLGLIINEIVTNSVKHAFSGIDKPKLSISLKSQNATDSTLTVSDNGIGIPGETELAAKATMGLGIIKALTQQLKGMMSVERNSGTTYTIIFKSNHDGN